VTGAARDADASPSRGLDSDSGAAGAATRHDVPATLDSPDDVFFRHLPSDFLEAGLPPQLAVCKKVTCTRKRAYAFEDVVSDHWFTARSGKKRTRRNKPADHFFIL